MNRAINSYLNCEGSESEKLRYLKAQLKANLD
jgi:hypothetical protein